jgi:alpha-beta hydrolase superfamily lysophospholipase
MLRREEPALPVFLMGNSLGGIIGLDYALHYPEGLRGVIAVAAPLGTLGVPRILLVLGRIVSRVWPSFSLETGMDLSGLAREPSVLEEVLADPLFHRRGSARLSTELAAVVAPLHEAAPRFPLPALLLHGSEDRMVAPDGSRKFAARVGHPDHRLIEYEGGYHALFADTGGDRVLADVEAWMNDRL